MSVAETLAPETLAVETPPVDATHHDAEEAASPRLQFKHDSHVMTHDLDHRARIQKALGGYYIKRDEMKDRFVSWQDARTAAQAIKKEAIDHLDRTLDTFARNMAARGANVFWAEDGEAARQYIVDVCKKAGTRVVKSKSMVTEEIHLNGALEKEGLEVIESDLGEYILQLREEAPYHIVFPAMHLTRGQVSDIFEEKLGTPASNSPEELTMIARRAMRDKYLRADVGITGTNFAVAEPGLIAITENEGNARLTMAMPRVHIAVLGIEKVLGSMDDLALFLPMLATAGAGQPLTCYNSMVFGPRKEGEMDGPEEMHIVLLDNGRTDLLADAEQRDALHCIRCGACLNVCPVFKNVGGHAYGTTYQGPIGAVITPHLRGLQKWKHLSGASSLCGACTESCPVKIDLHHHLLQNRRNAATEKPTAWEQGAWKGFAFMMTHPKIYRFAVRAGRALQPFHPLVMRTPLDPMRVWTASRSFPRLASKSFHDRWKSSKKGGPQ